MIRSDESTCEPVPLSAVTLIMALEKIKIGTMGFSYKDWVGNFYSEKTPPGKQLAHYVTKFNSIEIDSTFYRIPARSTVRKWAEIAPDGFTFSAKFPKTVTHEGRIEDRVLQAKEFIDTMSEMGDKLGVLLLQFPYSFKPDQRSLLAELLDELPSGPKVSIELRNRNWLTDNLFASLERRSVGFCLVEHPWVPRLNIKTADHIYIRMLGDRNQIKADFSYERIDRTTELNWWSERARDLDQAGGTIYTYFNNHFSGHSPTTASRFRKMIQG